MTLNENAPLREAIDRALEEVRIDLGVTATNQRTLPGVTQDQAGVRILAHQQAQDRVTQEAPDEVGDDNALEEIPVEMATGQSVVFTRANDPWHNASFAQVRPASSEEVLSMKHGSILKSKGLGEKIRGLASKELKVKKAPKEDVSIDTHMYD